MSIKRRIKKLIPNTILNNTLLALPFLYKTSLVNYETNLAARNGINDLLYYLEKCLHLDGNIIECGASRCGGSIIMANFLNSRNVQKKIYACDSFEGFDLNELKKERRLKLAIAPDNAFTSTSYGYVTQKIKKLGVDNIVVPVKGYFQNTIADIDSEYCFGLIDCDLKESIIYCGKVILPRLASKGVLLFDDYSDELYKGAKLGIDEFIARHEDEFSDHGEINRFYWAIKK